MNSSPVLITCPCGITFPIEDNDAESIQCECPSCKLTLQADLIHPDDEAFEDEAPVRPSAEDADDDDQLSDELRLPEDLLDHPSYDSDSGESNEFDSNDESDFNDSEDVSPEEQGASSRDAAASPKSGTASKDLDQSDSHEEQELESSDNIESSLDQKVDSPKPAKATAKLKKKDYLTRIVCTCGKRFKVDALGKSDYRVNCPECNKKLRIGNPKPRNKKKKKRKNRKENPVVECTCGTTFKVDTLEREFKCTCPGCQQVLVADGSSKLKIKKQSSRPDKYGGVMLVDPLTISSIEKSNLESQRKNGKPTQSGFQRMVRRIPMAPLLVATIGLGIVLLFMLWSLVN